MTFQFWCAVAGLLFLGMALIPNRLASWPLTTSAIYLGVGFVLGPMVMNLAHFEPLENAALLERLAEVTVIISLFGAGLKLRVPLSNWRWLVPLRLAFISMALTVGMVALAGFYLLKLPLGAAVLLGAILSPTDPVLASDVQVQHSKDDDRLRFSLTGEAGFNDGAAFPFVMLGLGLLGLHDLGSGGWKWLAVDVVWSIVGGLALGAVFGFLVARLVIWLRATHKEATGTDDFIALGLIVGTYGIALLLHTYGFLAVFAAGVALRHTERSHSEEESAEDTRPVKTPDEMPTDDQDIKKLREEIATHPDQAASFMAREILHFNEALERITELGLVVLLGAMLSRATLTSEVFWLAPLLFLVIRPLATTLGLLGSPKLEGSRAYIAWFGVRGIGSLYYLFYARQHGLSQPLTEQLLTLTFSIVAVSIVAHGISVTPLMKLYGRSDAA